MQDTALEIINKQKHISLFYMKFSLKFLNNVYKDKFNKEKIPFQHVQYSLYSKRLDNA